jgi:hypothetical protein
VKILEEGTKVEATAEALDPDLQNLISGNKVKGRGFTRYNLASKKGSGLLAWNEAEEADRDHVNILQLIIYLLVTTPA